MNAITVDVNTTAVKTEKSKKRLPNQNYPALTYDECRIVVDKILLLRKENQNYTNEDITAKFSKNGHNPRTAWWATVLYRSSVFTLPEPMITWMMQCDAEWLKKHPPTDPLNDSKGQCDSCGTELKFKLVCPCCNK